MAARLAKGGLLHYLGSALILKAGGVLALLGFHLVVAWRWGDEGAGLWFLTLAVVTIGAALGRLGMDLWVLRSASAALVEGSAVALVRTARRALGRTAILSSAIGLLLLAAAPALGRLFDAPQLPPLIAAAAFAVPAHALLVVNAHLLMGLRSPRIAALLLHLATPVAALAALLLLADRLGLMAAAVAFSAAAWAALGCGMLVWRQAAPKSRPRPPASGSPADDSADLGWLGIIEMASSWLPVLALGVWHADGDVGVFGAASRLAGAVGFVLVALNGYAAPSFVSGHRSGDGRVLAARAGQTSRAMALAGLPLLALLALFPEQLLGLFGPEFTVAAPAVLLLVAGQTINVLTGPAGYLLTMCGLAAEARNIAFAALLLGGGLQWLLVPRYGIEGAALAMALTVAFHHLTAAWRVRSRLGVWSVPWLPRGVRQ